MKKTGIDVEREREMGMEFVHCGESLSFVLYGSDYKTK